MTVITFSLRLVLEMIPKSRFPISTEDNTVLFIDFNTFIKDRTELRIFSEEEKTKAVGIFCSLK